MPGMSPALVSDFGRRIRLRRQALGMTQEDLAQRIGDITGRRVDVSSVIAWEKQKHRPTRHQGAIEATLGISLSPDAPAIDPELQRRIDALTPEEKALVIARLRGDPDPPLPPPAANQERREDGGRHRRAG